MRTSDQIRAYILRSLRLCDGTPLPESTIGQTVGLAFPNVSLTDGDLKSVVNGLQSEGYLTGSHDPIRGERVWLLTMKGVIAANSLP